MKKVCVSSERLHSLGEYNQVFAWFVKVAKPALFFVLHRRIETARRAVGFHGTGFDPNESPFSPSDVTFHRRHQCGANALPAHQWVRRNPVEVEGAVSHRGRAVTHIPDQLTVTHSHQDLVLRAVWLQCDFYQLDCAVDLVLGEGFDSLQQLVERRLVFFQNGSDVHGVFRGRAKAAASPSQDS
jgi:hypothetical protein